MAEDEQLEIAFWWFGGDSEHSIEDGLDDFLERVRGSRRRRLPWPGRRTASLVRRPPRDETRPVA